MTDLFEKSIRTLELPAVLEKLAAKAVSDAAKERLGLHGSPSFSGVKDVSAALTRADHGGMLNTRELLDVAGVLTASRIFRRMSASSLLAVSAMVSSSRMAERILSSR